MIKTYNKELVIAFAEINGVFDVDEPKALMAVYQIKRFMGIS